MESRHRPCQPQVPGGGARGLRGRASAAASGNSGTGRDCAQKRESPRSAPPLPVNRRSSATFRPSTSRPRTFFQSPTKSDPERRGLRVFALPQLMLGSSGAEAVAAWLADAAVERCGLSKETAGFRHSSPGTR